MSGPLDRRDCDAIRVVRSVDAIEAKIVELRSRRAAIQPNGGKVLVERQNLSLSIWALEWVLGEGSI